jgi:cell division protein FtsB
VTPVPLPLQSVSPRRRLLLAAVGLALLALVVHTLFGEKGYLALRQQQQELKRVQKEIQRLEQENRRLVEEIQTLKTDPQAMERVAREQLKMARPGEKVIILPPEKPTESGNEEKRR